MPFRSPFPASLALLVLAPAAAGQCFEQRVAPGYSCLFGYSSAELNGDTLLATYCALATHPSSVHVYERRPVGWVEVQTLTTDSDHDGFGWDTALGSGEAVIGVPRDDVPVKNGGAARVYERTPSGWLLTDTLRPPQPLQGDRFGEAVALDGDLLAVGAPGRREDRGTVTVYRRTSSGWERQQEISQPTPYARLGTVVALDGDRLVTSSPSKERVWIFEREGTEWIQRALLKSSFDSEYGRGLDVEGDRVVVGAPLLAGGGRVDVFERLAGFWTQTAEVKPDDPFAADYFGYDLDLRGDTLLVGNPLAGKEDRGEAYLFEHDGDGWQQARRLRAPSAEGEDYQGVGVSLGESLVAVLAWNPASVRLYDRAGPGHTERLCDAEPNSTGEATTLLIGGYLALWRDQFVLRAIGAPPGQLAQFFYGAVDTQSPFGDGYLCIDPPHFRLPPVQVEPNGRARLPVDLDAPPAGSGPGELTPGSSWVFQLWYRDPGGAAGFNTSDAVRVTFCP